MVVESLGEVTTRVVADGQIAVRGRLEREVAGLLTQPYPLGARLHASSEHAQPDAGIGQSVQRQRKKGLVSALPRQRERLLTHLQRVLVASGAAEGHGADLRYLGCQPGTVLGHAGFGSARPAKRLLSGR